MHALRFSLALGLAGAGAAFAQAPAVQPLGAVAEVHGLVTMSIGSQVATVQEATPVFDGARFVTSSSGGAELRLQGGCTVPLKPNQMVTISSSLNCPQQISAVQTIADTAAASGSFLGRGTLPLVAAAALAAAVGTAKEPEITPRHAD